MAEIREQKLLHHALVIPCPFQGHINPAIHLSLKLASKGFIITFINTEFVHSQITKSQSTDPNIFSKARESGLDIRYSTVSDGFPLYFDRNLNSLPFLEGLINGFSVHVDELIGKLMSDNCVDDHPITCLIADSFLVWPSIVAKKYELVNVSFFTEPALVFALYYHLDLLEENGHFGSDGAFSDLLSLLSDQNVHELLLTPPMVSVTSV